MELPDNGANPALIAEYIRGYVLASYLYYAGPDTLQSPWTDTKFDGCVGFLTYWRDRLPWDFRIRIFDGDLKTEAHALQFSDEEKAAAVKWAASGKHWPE